MKKYTTEQITEACNKLGIDSNMFINELPTKRERKVKEPIVLVLPYQSIAFIDKWGKLKDQPKWRRKTQEALQAALDWLGKYPEDIAIQAMNDSLMGGWQGLFEPKGYVKYESKVHKILQASFNQDLEIKAKYSL